jgi:hypothetical protein
LGQSSTNDQLQHVTKNELIGEGAVMLYA